MYESYYSLSERPFDLTSNPRYLFLTSTHREALSNLVYGVVARKGIVLMLGDAGTGKTTIIRAALAQLRDAGHSLAHLSSPTLSKVEFYEFVGNAFGVPADARGSKVRLLDVLAARLDERAAAGRCSALIVDEAQSLPHELLEEIRLLSNLENDERKLLTVVLAGQPELADRLNDASLRQLKQRIALRCQLRHLDLRETAAYIAKRIRVAGGDSGVIFTRDAIVAIASCSRGIPRSISVICDNALISGFAADRHPIDRDIVMDVCRDFDLEASSDPVADVVSEGRAVPDVPARPAEHAGVAELAAPVGPAGGNGKSRVLSLREVPEAPKPPGDAAGADSRPITPSVLQYPGSRVARGSILGLSGTANEAEEATPAPRRKRFLFF